jgi:hypothetical protein
MKSPMRRPHSGNSGLVSLVSANPRTLINQVNSYLTNGYKLVSMSYKIRLIFVRYTAIMTASDDDFVESVEINILKIQDKL